MHGLPEQALEKQHHMKTQAKVPLQETLPLLSAQQAEYSFKIAMN